MRITWSLLVAMALLLMAHAAFAARLQVLLLGERFPGTDARFVDELKTSLEGQGYAVKAVDADALVPALKGGGGRDSILICPNAAWFPLEAQSALLDYLSGGGNLLAIGGPFLSRQAVRIEGRWFDEQAIARSAQEAAPAETVLDFASLGTGNLHSFSGRAEVKCDLRVIASGVVQAPSALQIRLPSFDSWVLVEAPIRQGALAHASGIAFWAKGGPNVRTIYIHLNDSEDTAWRTTVHLTPSWKRYTLPFNQFTPKPGESRRGVHRVDASKVDGLQVGLESANLAHPDQSADYAVSNVRAIHVAAGDSDFAQPTLETLSPAYKTYQTECAELTPTWGSYVEVGDEAIPAKAHWVCSLPRYRGMGFNPTAPNRWIPTQCVRMADGHIGGAAAALYVQDSDPYRGTVWATLGVDDPAYLAANGPVMARQAIALVNRIDRGLFLLSGGVDRASYFEQIPSAGAVIVNLGESRGPVEAETTITTEQGAPIWQSGRKGAVPEPRRTVIQLGSPGRLRPGFYVATTSLYLGGEMIDRIRQPFSVVESKPVSRSELVTVKGDLFYYHGKPWYSLGVNYRPLYTAALESGPFWAHWANPNQYDPEIVELDLALMKRLGMNTASVIFEDGSRIPGLVDMMERANRLGLKCNVFLGGLHPLQTNLSKAEAMIREARLAERPAMFAYDMGWEVRIGREESRQGADGAWKRWLEDRYGSVENAEKDWEFTLRKDADGRVHGPTDRQISEDGPWRRMVAAYRRFWDDRISHRYIVTTSFMRKLDPYHLLSTRSGWGGTGALVGVPQMPFDLLSGARHLDFISPEGYNFVGPWETFRETGLTTLYGKFVSGGKPVCWSEFGFSASFPTTPESLERQRQFYEKVHRVFRETRSAGSAAWWWPGYLIGERSDYSIINPDYTPRPAGLELLKLAKQMVSPVPAKKPDTWIEIDRDLYVNGYAGILLAKRKEYGRAMAAGKSVGLRTRGTGTDSASFPRVAVGNTPLNGKNPPKYLNGEFNSLEIQDASGRWVPLEDGDKVIVKPNQPVLVRASLGNTAEARWLAPQPNRLGGVFLQALANGKPVLAPIGKDTPSLADTSITLSLPAISSETRVSFQLVTGGIVFGEKRYVVLATVPFPPGRG